MWFGPLLQGGAQSQAGGAGSQSLAAGLLTNTSALFAPAATPGAVALSAPLITSAAQVFSPALGPGAIALAAPTIDSAIALFAPALNPGAVSVGVPLLPSSGAFFVPTVTQGSAAAQGITAPLLSNTQSLYTPVMGEYAPPTGIVFDPATKRVVLDSASVTATELYSRSADWLALSDNAKYGAVFRQVGGDDLGGGLSIPLYFFLQGAWRVRPMEANHSLTITGNLFVEGGGIPVVQTLGTYQVNVNYTVPVQAQGISTSGSTGPTAAEVADAVRAILFTELARIDVPVSTRSTMADIFAAV